MFQRRKTRKPSFDLIASFNKDYPNLPSLLHFHPSGKPRPLSSPLPVTSDNSVGFMSFDPRQFESYEDTFEEQPDDHGLPSNVDYAQPPVSQAGPGSYNFGSYGDFPTPNQWQQTPGAVPFYPTQMQMQYSWPSSFHPPGMPTPSSRSHSLPSSIHGQQPAYLSLQDVQLQPAFPSIDFNAGYRPFSPQALASQSPYKFQHDPSALPAPALPSQIGSRSSRNQQPTASSDFRFLVTLMNGTAMVRENEIPVSYLNKRQPYKIKIKDTQPQQTGPIPTTYRTYIRISFHEEKQRAHPDQHWQLWKEGRGMNEAQQHGGKLHAVEYVPSSSGPGHHLANVHVEKENFDGFCVTWTAPSSHPPECEVQFRCNFLSTDFSRSKGVKGIPVRLCAKSEVVGFPSIDASTPPPEICYCKIKLFRDHGAERKLTNDESAVRRHIAKTEEQIKQIRPEEEGEYSAVGPSGKRRASVSSPSMARPSKIARYKRGNSVSSDNSSQDPETVESDLPLKMGTLNKLLRSKHEVTVFNLQGAEADDPDLHPVSLLDTTVPASTSDSPDDKRMQRRNPRLTESSAQSGQATDSTAHPVSPAARGLQLPTPGSSHRISGESQLMMKTETSADSWSSNAQHLASPKAAASGPVKRVFARVQAGEAVDVIDVDPGYLAPSGVAVKPVACFYVQFKASGSATQPNYHRAVYLYERNASSFILALARKQGIDPDDVTEACFVAKDDRRGLQVELDDDLISQMPEGQDMAAEFSTIQQHRSSSRRIPDPRSLRYSLMISY